MKEQWKDIIIEQKGVLYDYTGLYQVSNCGRVRSLNYLHTGETKILKLTTGTNGYLQIILCKNGKKNRFLVHRLVATAFIENDDIINKIEVNHKDENRANNSVENLEWCNRKYNISYGTRTKKSADKHLKRIICIETGIIYESSKEVEDVMGIEKENINRCCRGRYKTSGGYHWKYYNDYLIEQLIAN